ncbi:MAG: DNA repair protein, partial [Pseudomonadota bacterium]
AAGRTVADSDFKHAYSGAEANEIVTVLQKLQAVQRVVLAVNQEYIRSAAMDELFRTEPPFKLQGSYRNMNKLAEKILPVMNDDEIDALLDDHYAGESQLLTGEAEFNVLRLAEMRDKLGQADAQRLADIRQEFRRSQSMGGRDADAGQALANQLSHIHTALESLSDTGNSAYVAQLARLNETIAAMDLTVVNQPSQVVEEAMQRLAATIETTFMPVVASMDKKIDLDLAILRRVNDLREELDEHVDQSQDSSGE